MIDRQPPPEPPPYWTQSAPAARWRSASAVHRFLGGDAESGEAFGRLPRAQAGVHQEAAGVGRDQGAVARAAAAQNGEGEHAVNKPEIRVSCKMDAEL